MLSREFERSDANSAFIFALDHHAVLGGSDDGFPWYARGMLALEAGEVVCLRLEKFADGGEEREREAQLMVMDKIFAAFEAGASWLGRRSRFHHGPLPRACRRQRQAARFRPDPAARC